MSLAEKQALALRDLAVNVAKTKGIVTAPDIYSFHDARITYMSYVIRREIMTDRRAIVFEFDQHSESELLRDFPWLQQIHGFAYRHRHLPDNAQVAVSPPRTHRSRQPQSNAAPYRLWSWMLGDAWTRFTSIFGIGVGSNRSAARWYVPNLAGACQPPEASERDQGEHN
jgi:hypothetical protein